MLLLIDLLDQENKPHDTVKFEFDDQATIEQLQARILSCFQISIDCQRIFDKNGRRIDLMAGSMLDAGLQNDENLILKHALLSQWSALLESETSFQQTNEPALQKSIQNRSTGIIKALTDSLFFVTYSKFNNRCTSIEKKFLTATDRKLAAIKSSCEVYFEKLYGKSVKLSFGSRDDGSRSGCICVIEDQSKISKFFVKTHHNAGSQSSHTRYDLDLRELFVYKFLERLEMGPEVHFIDNEFFSRWIIYIASREVSGFRTLEFLELTEPQNIKEYSKSVIQMLFIYSILMLGDYHTANMGVDSAGNPFIVDFFIIGKSLASVKDMYDNVRMAEKFNKNLGTFNERIEISLEFLNNSNFLTVLESSVERFLQHQKPTFDKSRLVSDKPHKTDDLMEYIENVKRNVKLFKEYSLCE